MGKIRNVYKTLLGILKGREHSEDQHVDGRKFRKTGQQGVIGFIWLCTGTSGGIY
jgi:hypothetical protein